MVNQHKVFTVHTCGSDWILVAPTGRPLPLLSVRSIMHELSSIMKGFFPRMFSSFEFNGHKQDRMFGNQYQGKGHLTLYINRRKIMDNN